MNESIGFEISDLARLFRRRFDERARAVGVTRAQWRVLLLLSRREGEHQGALAEMLDVEPITLCRMIDRLADSGLVERRRNPDDRRVWRIFLTDQSRPILGRLRAIGDELVEAALVGLDEPARSALSASLAVIRANLGAPSTSASETAHG